MPTFNSIDPLELQRMLAQGALQLVDVRGGDEVARGMIPGAVHVALHLLPMRWNELRDDIPIVFYCHSGVRSAQACEYMARQDYNQLYNLQGGVLAWARAGLAFAAPH